MPKLEGETYHYGRLVLFSQEGCMRRMMRAQAAFLLLDFTVSYVCCRENNPVYAGEKSRLYNG